MDDSRLQRLSKRQRECLRGVANLKPYKQIANELAIAESTVKGHVEDARKTLSAPTVRAAALEFREWESAATRPIGGSKSTGHFKRADDYIAQPSNVDAQSGNGRFEQSDEPGRVRDAAASRPWPQGDKPRLSLPFAGGGRRPDDLSWLARLGWTFVILALLVVAVGVFVIAADGLRQIVWAGRS